jgi:hypothetical protein
MIDLTEEFFTEIYPKYRKIALSINDDKILDNDITGNCAVLSVRGKSNVRSLSKLISSNGFKPTVLEFEDVLRSKGRVQKKLKNIDILISHAKDTPVHIFSGSENYHYEKFLGKDGILVRTKFSNYKITPDELIRVLFVYIQTTGNLDCHFQDITNYKNVESLLFPVDIKETVEYSELLNTYKFEKGLTDIRPVPHKEKKPLFSFIQKKNSKEMSQLVKFTFICNKKIEKRHLRLLETELNNIFTMYGRNDLKANVQTVYEGKLLVGAA